METISTTIKLRPLRIGFLVDPSDRKILSEVMRLATSLWGGLLCPMIPVARRLPRCWSEPHGMRASALEVAHGTIQFFEPDILMQTAPRQFDTLGFDLAKRPMRIDRFIDLADFISKAPGSDADFTAGVNMSDVYSHLLRSEFQFKKRVDPQILYFKEGERIATAFFEACFGYFPKNTRLNYIERDYKQSFDAQHVSPAIEHWLSICNKQAGYPLYYTIRDMELQYGRWQNPTVFIFDPVNPADVIDFWNLRLIAGDILPVNIHWLQESRETIANFVREHSPQMPAGRQSAYRTTIQLGRSLDGDATMRQLDLTSLVAQDKFGTKHYYDRIWEPGDHRIDAPAALTAKVKAREIQLLLTGKPRESVQISSELPDFKTYQSGGRPAWVNIIKPRTFLANNSLVDAAPSTGFSDDLGFPAYAMQNQFASREGYVSFHNYPHDSRYFYLPTRFEGIANWLYNRGIEATPSDAGRAADQLIEAVDGLVGVALFRYLEIIEQLNSMAKSRRQWTETESEESPDRTAPVGQWLGVFNKIKKASDGYNINLNRFVEAGVLRLGLSIPCTHCTKENWYSLDDVAASIRCERCLKMYDYPQGEEQKPSRWRYRVIGPFAAPNYAQGAYTVALTLRFLGLVFAHPDGFTWSTSLDLKMGTQKLETDFFAWRSYDPLYGRNRPLETLVGECKSLGEQCFKEKDIARLQELGTALPGVYLVAATLKSKFSQAEVKLLRSLATWGWRQRKQTRMPSKLILLTANELCAGSNFTETWNGAKSPKSPVLRSYGPVTDLDALAESTQRSYLGFSDLHIIALKHGRAVAASAKRSAELEGES